jgi:hypothetical protein
LNIVGLKVVWMVAVTCWQYTANIVVLVFCLMEVGTTVVQSRLDRETKLNCYRCQFFKLLFYRPPPRNHDHASHSARLLGLIRGWCLVLNIPQP